MTESQLERNFKLLLELGNGTTKRRSEQIRSQIVTENKPLVLDRLKRIMHTKKITDDDIQSGMLGLVETINMFDPTKSKSLGTLGHFRILYNTEKYKEHLGGIKVPKNKTQDYQFKTKEYKEDRQAITDKNSTKLDWILSEAEHTLSEIELKIFLMKISSKRLKYKELASVLNMEKNEVNKIYKRAYEKVINHCKEVLHATNSRRLAV